MKIRSEHPRITVLTPFEMSDQFLAGTLPAFDAMVTFSSIEHSGLGRYGDELNPHGDVITMVVVVVVAAAAVVDESCSYSGQGVVRPEGGRAGDGGRSQWARPAPVQRRPNLRGGHVPAPLRQLEPDPHRRRRLPRKRYALHLLLPAGARHRKTLLWKS